MFKQRAFVICSKRLILNPFLNGSLVPLRHHLALKESREIERQPVLDLPFSGKLETWWHTQLLSVPGTQAARLWSVRERVPWSETHICPSLLLSIPCCVCFLVWVPGVEAYDSLVVSRIQGCWRGWSLYGRLLGKRELWEERRSWDVYPYRLRPSREQPPSGKENGPGRATAQCGGEMEQPWVSQGERPLSTLTVPLRHQKDHA